jgi:hypothetical protein
MRLRMRACMMTTWRGYRQPLIQKKSGLERSVLVSADILKKHSDISEHVCTHYLFAVMLNSYPRATVDLKADKWGFTLFTFH